MPLHGKHKQKVYQLNCEYCQEGMELGRGTLLDSNVPRGKGHSLGMFQSSVVLALLLHLGRKNPANKNLDKQKKKKTLSISVLFNYCIGLYSLLKT